MKILTALVCSTFLSVGANAFDYPEEHSGLLELGAGYTAGLMCSCLFVMKQSYGTCEAFARPNPNLVWYQVDNDKQEVTSWYLWKSQTHRLVSPKLGCASVQSLSKG